MTRKLVELLLYVYAIVATMKFQMLAMGSRFEFEGKEYVKTGPLTATTETGGQRMIPRSAVLKPVDVPDMPTQRVARNLDEAVVMAAFAEFVDDCARLLQTYANGLQTQDWNVDLNAARQRFLAELAQPASRDE